MKNPIGSVVVVIGAVLGILGVFLPFVSMDVAGVDFSMNVFKPICIAWIVLAVGAVACAFAGQKILTLILAILAGGGFLISFFVNASDLDQLGEVGKGLGYWFLIIGGIFMILSGIVYMFTFKKAKE